MVAGWILIFWLDLLSAGCALAWLYLSAPGSFHIPFLGNISPDFLYQSGWGLLWLTALVSYYVVIMTIRTVIRRDNKTADITSIGQGALGAVTDCGAARF